MASQASKGTAVRTMVCLFGCVGFSGFFYVFVMDRYASCFDLQNRWLMVEYVSLFINLGAIAAWVFYKESSWIVATIVTVLLPVFASVATCVYVITQFLKLSPEEFSKDPIYFVLVRRDKRDDMKHKNGTLVTTVKIIFSTLACLVLGIIINLIIVDGSPFCAKAFSSCMIGTLLDFYATVGVLSIIQGPEREMGIVLRSILPTRASKKDEDDDYNVEYSFATEYMGPPISYEIPKAVPVDVGSIPTASVVSTPLNSGYLSLPVIYPVDSQENENSHEFSISSDGDGADNDCHEIEELSASEDDQTHLEIPDYYDKTTQIVTFREPKSRTMVQDESGYTEPGMVVPERPRANPNVKTGLCHRCLKGNRFTMKESCIVCDAKYCSKCVLRMMGSTPEGRKCISCIGCPIDESKREQLGKCSKVLKQVLNDFQINQAMLSEVSCQVNQAPHWLIFVNGKPLSFDEVFQLQTWLIFV
ncbi:hypothetical protein R6Q59_022703 [Mikania micrantha]